ncbi:MAG: hypothetical protein JNM56_03755, partial [Planctomycetia bacterium]|nr:hypothetical protein [Planctomycetia bacterium]
MNAKTAAVPEMQSELSRVALSLEAFVVNGIPLGVMQSTSFPGFLGKVAGNLTRELDNLETHAVSHGLPDTVATPLTSLRTRCGELVRSVGALTNFQAMPFPQVRSAVQQVRGAWQECVQA